MRFPSKDVKRVLPGIFTSIMVISTCAILLFLSVDTNNAPHAMIEETSHIVGVGDPILFNGTGSSDPDGDEISYLWTINDTMYNMESIFFFSFPSPGNFTVVLRVEDEAGLSDIETVIIDVR